MLGTKQRRVFPCPARVVAVAAGLAALASAPAAQVRLRDGLTVFRPQHGAGYFPFARTAVPEALEDDPALGAGIRVNGTGEIDAAGEDDLVELVARRVLDGTELVLERSNPALRLWRTRDKQPGTAVLFGGNRTAPLVFGGGGDLTLWVEWNGAAAPGLATLALRTVERDLAVDCVEFHAFEGLVVALGGEGQTPSLPLDPNHGTFVIGTALYRLGWDVLMRDEDEVGSTGAGPVYDEVVNAIQHRAVTDLAIFGYSHGGGSTYDLCERLDAFRATIGTFTIGFTSYVDGIQNDSDTDTDMETRRPISTAYHANHYQRGTFTDFFLDGGPVPSSQPPPSGLDVETIFWGSGATHFIVDDYGQVKNFIQSHLETSIVR